MAQSPLFVTPKAAMARILVAYASTEGQTRKIADYLVDTLRTRGHAVDCLDCASPAAAQFAPPAAGANGAWAGVILAGSVHQSKYQAALVHFASTQRAWLATLPCAFVSVSLMALLDDDATRGELERLAHEFCAQAGIAPALVLQARGALRYTQYDWFKRMMMKLIAQKQGAGTDTSRDHEFTNWDELQQFADRFAALLSAPAAS
jgi:menaquinone-dependent protoporphyrinogen oxidase